MASLNTKKEIKKSILGYLFVLDYRPVIDKLSHAEYIIGSENIMGCCLNLLDFFEQNKKLNTFCIVQVRERLNCKLPFGDPKLQEATAYCAEHLFSILKSESYLKKNKDIPNFDFFEKYKDEIQSALKDKYSDFLKISDDEKERLKDLQKKKKQFIEELDDKLNQILKS